MELSNSLEPTNVKGFSLIELMITLLIAAIIIAMGLPQLRDMSNTIRFANIQQNLISNLLYARSEAVKNGSNTLVCGSSDGVTCSAIPSNWSQGWIIFTDENNNGLYDGDTVDTPRRIQTIDSIASITWSNVTPVVFEGDGTVNNTSSGTFLICDGQATSSISRGVTINLSGRVRSTDAVTCP
ncbi:GspH/FimT family pseudopilin [Endozoicomonas arenosclerae]|uniref:GspH/FimT family pseudopilin n=1 Tax=Endozoicomonas arenosclerae TaxID=1633495 RepID=UPI0007822FCE|nr:GspH/FimT family pseudopilin [Endozoicomonas arenosclerae]